MSRIDPRRELFKEKVKIAVEERLALYDGDTKKALASLKKEAVYLDLENKVPLTFGTCISEEVVIKYPITNLSTKDVDYIVDERIKTLVRDRLTLYNNKEKEAFKEPLFYDAEQRIPILSVRCFTGLNTVEPVKKDQAGKDIGFVLTKNNHHIALYEDEKGNLVELPSTFWHSVERKAMFVKHFTREERDKLQENTIIKNPQMVWDKILLLPDDLFSQTFLEKLPKPTWKFVVSLQRNEMFVFSLTPEEVEMAALSKDYKQINKHLYRVQKLSESDFNFRLHTETKVDDNFNGSKNPSLAVQLGKAIRLKSLSAWKQRNPVKVRINNLGQIVKIG
ncbi:MAG: hypothetical protein EOP48_26770 [Sphingobacteriales bacterium]|nr:MAG: hypothetical protein EOP48_26770 [Sphingobacteriales bacterium]